MPYDYQTATQQLSIMKDDGVSKSQATQMLLGFVVKYGGDAKLAQMIIDADVQLAALMIGQAALFIQTELPKLQAVPVDMPAALLAPPPDPQP
jgi:hypothetical protein